MPRTVNNNQLTPGNVFFVRGIVGFSRISRQTTDEERTKDNLRRVHKIDKNYTTISIYNAQVLARNPQQPTFEERYGLESCYNSSKAADYPGLNYTAMNKSQFLPKVGVLEQGSDPNNHPAYKEIQLEGELQKGTDVTLVMRVFAGQGNNGVSLDTVLINQTDFQYYGNNANVKNALADYGITFDAMSPEEKAAAAPVPAPAATETAGQAAPQGMAQAMPQQNMAQTQAAAPQATGNIFNQFGAVPQSQAAPVQDQNQAAAQPQQGTPTTPFDFGGQPGAAGTPQNVQFGVGPGRTY